MIAAGFLLVACLGGALWFFSDRAKPGVTTKGSAPPAFPEKSVAVLPFENRSEDKANTYFADGVQDEILTYLAKIADLKGDQPHERNALQKR
ncbi:MAG: hypothetical protein H0W04_02595 [Chthoniobacterales bacterium]|nr:hypothetical protein [Chthoniobacterales bacterium]